MRSDSGYLRSEYVVFSSDSKHLDDNTVRIAPRETMCRRGPKV